jgi:hypothetical protein
MLNNYQSSEKNVLLYLMEPVNKLPSPLLLDDDDDL